MQVHKGLREDYGRPFHEVSYSFLFSSPCLGASCSLACFALPSCFSGASSQLQCLDCMLHHCSRWWQSDDCLPGHMRIDIFPSLSTIMLPPVCNHLVTVLSLSPSVASSPEGQCQCFLNHTDTCLGAGAQYSAFHALQ